MATLAPADPKPPRASAGRRQIQGRLYDLGTYRRSSDLKTPKPRVAGSVRARSREARRLDGVLGGRRVILSTREARSPGPDAKYGFTFSETNSARGRRGPIDRGTVLGWTACILGRTIPYVLTRRRRDKECHEKASSLVRDGRPEPAGVTIGQYLSPGQEHGLGESSGFQGEISSRSTR